MRVSVRMNPTSAVLLTEEDLVKAVVKSDSLTVGSNHICKVRRE